MHRGVPHFILGYSASEDVLTRALPVLVFWFLLTSLGAINLDWDWQWMVITPIAGLLVLLASWIALNAIRGRRLLQPPQRVGWTEIALFVIVPAFLPLIFGGDLLGTLIIVIGQLVFLGLVFVITSYGMIAIAVWALVRLVLTLAQTFRLFTRGLPLLLIGFMFLFINAEAWQSAGELPLALLWTVVILLCVLAAIFLMTQIPRELRGLNDFSSWDQLERVADNAPVQVPDADSGSVPATAPLTLREKGNLWLVVFVTQGFRLGLVSAMVGGFFIVLGVLMIQQPTIQLWIGSSQEVRYLLEPIYLFGYPLQLSVQLLQVASFLGAFAAVYFSVYTTTDKNLRDEFFEDTVSEVRQNLAARSIYRSAYGVDEDRAPGTRLQRST